MWFPALQGVSRTPRSRLLLGAIVLLVGAAAWADVSIEATLSPQRAQVGEPLHLSITVVGAQQAAAPALNVGDDFDIQYIGPSTQISIVNGRMDARVQHLYSVTPRKEGHFTLGPFPVDVQGQHFQTPAFTVDIVAGSIAGAPAPSAQGGVAPGHNTQPAGDVPHGLRLVLSVPRQEVYLHERLPVDVTLYVPPIFVSDVNYPTLAADGLSLEKFPEPSQRQQNIDQKTYKVLHFQTTVVPLRAGALTLGPATLRLSVNRGGSPFQDDPFFSRFFQNGFTAQRPVDLTSEAIPLTVLPLPEEGKPPGFSGAVGTFTMDVKASPIDVVAGDPITVTSAVSGSGNLGDAEPPHLADASGFRTYEAHVTNTAGGSNSFTVGKTYEQVIIPNDTTVAAVPSVRFTYFDPQARRYQSLQSQPIGLVIHPRQETGRTEIVTAGQRVQHAPEEHLGRDIVFIKDDTGRFTARSAHWYLGVPFLLWQLVPPLLFVAAVWYDRQRRRLTGDLRYARFTRAGRDARRGLAGAADAVARGDREQFYNAVSRTMQDYLGAKLDLPPGDIDADAAGRGGVSKECVERIRQFFSTCEQVRFAPASTDGDMRGTLTVAQDIIRTLEREQTLKRRPTASGEPLKTAAPLVTIALLFIGWAAPAHAGAPIAFSPQTTFFHANTLYKDGQYDAAIQEYEQLLHADLESGNLYFNLGNAYFKAGDIGKAILNYERAEHLIPDDPDLRANLAYAQSQTDAEPCLPPVWHRFAFPLAHRVATRRLVWAATAAYTLFFVALIIYRLWPRRQRWLFYGSAGLAAASLVIALSLADQVMAEDWQRQAVVIASGETPTRFEPAPNGTVHFVLKQGSVVQVTETRDGWLQIERCDGRRGWLERAAIEELRPVAETN